MHTLFIEAVSDTTSYVGRVTIGDLDRPTPCSDWNLGNLLTHMIGEIDGFTEAVLTGDAPTNHLRRSPVTVDAVTHEWERSTAVLTAAFAATDPAKAVKLADFGELPVGTLLGMQLLDVAVHTWDIAQTFGEAYQPSDPIVEHVHSLAQQVARHGGDDSPSPAFAPPSAMTDDLNDWQSALALLGR